MNEQAVGTTGDDRAIAWLLGLAKERADLRAMLLTSTRSGAGEPDFLSDYDVMLFVTDVGAWLEDEAWLGAFGPVLVMCRTHWEDERIHSRLVRYQEGNRIDFALAPATMLEEMAAAARLPDYLEAGYRVLADKDGVAARLPAASGRAFIPPRPSEQEFRDLVAGFWWDSTYVAKHLWRDELFPAKWMLDYSLRFDYLRPLLEWYIETEHDWSLPAGHQGRWLKRRLPAGLWAKVEATFAGASREDNWEALFRTCEVFREVASLVAGRLGYEYPRALDDRVLAYLREVRATPGAAGE